MWLRGGNELRNISVRCKSVWAPIMGEFSTQPYITFLVTGVYGYHFNHPDELKMIWTDFYAC